MPFDMLKLISSYPISRRLIIAFALAAILPSIMIAIMGIYYVNQLGDRRNASSVIASAQDSTSSWSNSLHRLYTQTKVTESQILSVLLTSNSMAHITVSSNLAENISRTTQDSTQLTSQLSTYQALYDPTQSQNMQPVTVLLAPTDSTPDTETSLLTSIAKNSWPQYRDAQTKELNLLQQIITHPARYAPVSSAVAKISADANTLNATYNQINLDWNQIGSYVSNISKHVNGIDVNETQPIIMGTVGAFLLTLLVVIVAGVLVNRSISGPLNELVLLTRRISKGDRHARAHINSHDEISIVATAMNSMLDNIVHLVQDTQAQRDVLQGQVEKLVSEVSGVGDGDLRVNAEVTADALGVLADSFNYMVEELGSLVVRVKRVAREVEESTNLTTDRMSELVDTADRQIQEIANAAFEIERMAINSQQVAQRALALASSAREARITAQGGRLAVQQSIEGMGRIYSYVQETSSKVQTLGERSREINNIVEAISNIAHQTNRLALDAAIQAAMAGENGKGFGAVAADIRRLAERAKELATSVGRIVRSVRDDIGAVAIAMNDTEREASAGSTIAEEAGTSLESIVAAIERQADEIEDINQMALQQQQSSGEVVQMMQNVSETTQQSTTSTREAALNMERVARLAEQLLASVEAFKLRDDLNYLEPEGMSFAESLANRSTPGGSFRTVTATAQPVSNGSLYNTPTSSVEGFFPQFATTAYQPGNGTGPAMSTSTGPQGRNSPFPSTGSGPSTQPPVGYNSGQFSFLSPGNGSTTWPPQGYNGGQMAFPSTSHDQQPLPMWNNEETYQSFSPQTTSPRDTQPRPSHAAADWQPNNWNPADWQA